MNSTEIERLIVTLVGDATSYTNMMAQAGNAVSRTTQQVQQHSQMLDMFRGKVTGIISSFAAFAPMLAGGLGIASLAAATAGAVTLAANLEDTSISFEVLLGSASKAKKMLDEIRAYANVTPFEQAPLQRSAQMLMNYGIAAESIMPTLKMLGEVSTGDQGKLDGLSYAFAQMTARGKVMGDDLRQMVNFGFNPLAEMSRTSGKSMAALTDEMHKGAITIPMLNEAFRTASSSGGRFFGMMDKKAVTLKGLWSTLRDNITYPLTQIGEVLIKELNLKGAVTGAIAFANTWTPTIINGIKTAFDYARTTISYLTPIVQSVVAATIAQWQFFYGIFSQVFNDIYTVGSQIWRQLFGNFSISLKDVQYAIVSMGITAEFIFKNIQQIGEAAFLALQYAALAYVVWYIDTALMMVETIGTAFQSMGNYISTTMQSVTAYLVSIISSLAEAWLGATESIMTIWKDAATYFLETPFIVQLVDAFVASFQMLRTVWAASLNFFQTSWQETFNTAYTIVVTAFTNIKDTVISMMKKMWDWVKGGGQGQLDIGFNPMEMNLVKPIEDAIIAVNELEGDLKNKLKTSLDALKTGFSEFHAKRIAELLPPDLAKPILDALKMGDAGALNAGMQIGNSIGTGLKAAKPFDAAIAGSKEAAEHIASYQEGLMRKPTANPALAAQQKTAQSMEQMLPKFDELIGVVRDFMGEPPFVIDFNPAGLA